MGFFHVLMVKIQSHGIFPCTHVKNPQTWDFSHILMGKIQKYPCTYGKIQISSYTHMAKTTNKICGQKHTDKFSPLFNHHYYYIIYFHFGLQMRNICTKVYMPGIRSYDLPIMRAALSGLSHRGSCARGPKYYTQ